MSLPSKSWFVDNLPLWLYITLFKAGGWLYFITLPVFGERVFPIWMVGLCIGAASLFQLLLDVPAGMILDRWGYARLLRFSSISLIMGGVILSIFGLHSWTYLSFILFSGIGWLFFGPGVDAYTLRIAPRTHTGRFMSIRRLTSSLGAVIGATLFTLLLNKPPQTIGIVVAAILACATIVGSLLKKEPHRSHIHKATQTHSVTHPHIFARALHTIKALNPASSMLIFSGFAAATFYGIVSFVIPLHLKDAVHAGPLQFALSIFDLTVILCGGFIGRLADSNKKRLFVFLGLCLFALSSTFMSMNLNSWFLVFGFMASVGDELLTVSLWSWLNHLNHDHVHDGLIASIIAFFQDLGWVIGPIIAGFAYTRFGASQTILFGAGVVCISWAINSIALRNSAGTILHTPPSPLPVPYHDRHKE
ncbi:MFS transporter [Patescibacteria group bacterium]|nr:MFS transporter [Patescibacteria group bacterium]MBP9709413.1 MFS transporter [Patescibacteria group bacterium]